MAVTANYARCYELSRHAGFQQRLQIALLNQVAVVAAEDPETFNHSDRLSFGAQVAYNPAPWADKMALGCIVVSSDIQGGVGVNNTPDQSNAAVTDAHISAAVAVVWDFYADTAVALAGTTGSKVL